MTPAHGNLKTLDKHSISHSVSSQAKPVSLSQSLCLAKGKAGAATNYNVDIGYPQHQFFLSSYHTELLANASTA